MDRGSIWFNEINDQLKDTSIGIICLTQENKNRPWILFEAGALVKGLSSSRVCTFLIDLESTDIRDPLAQFNHTFPTKESMKGLIETLNNQLGTQALDHRILQTVFDTYWPQFDEKFRRILAEIEPSSEAKPREQADILTEILENTRSLSSRVSRLESRQTISGVKRVPTANDLNLVRSDLYDKMIDEVCQMKLDDYSDEEVLSVLYKRGILESLARSILDSAVKKLAFNLK